jgi:hypothetical protein
MLLMIVLLATNQDPEGLYRPAVLVNPEVVLTGYKPEEAEGMLNYQLSKHGIKKASFAQKLEIHTNAGFDLYCGGTVDMVDGDANTVHMTAKFGQRVVTVQVCVTEVALMERTRPLNAMYLEGLDSVLSQISKPE